MINEGRVCNQSEGSIFSSENTFERLAGRIMEGRRPDPLPEPKYQSLLDGVRVTVGEQSRDYRGGVDVVALRGKNIRIVVSPENTDLHGAYNVRDQIINFGQSALADFESDQDLFWSACIHELAHMRYFDLDKQKQAEVNDFVVREFSDQLVRFQEELYSAEGGGVMRMRTGLEMFQPPFPSVLRGEVFVIGG